MKKKVIVLFGGNSSEYEVSCSSAASIIEHIDRELFDVIPIGITRENMWLLTEAKYEAIKDGYEWIKHEKNKHVMLSTTSMKKGLLVFNDDNSISNIDFDAILPILHGENGEDGSIQGLFQLANAKYIGSDICASACSMDKVVTTYFVEHLDMKIPKCYHISPNIFFDNIDYYTNEAECYHEFTYPVVVKPSKTGSSVGVNIARDKIQLKEYMIEAGKFEGEIMVEQFIKCRELKVAILGIDELTVGAVCEVIIKNDSFNDYETKYKSNGTHKCIPADINESTAEKVKTLAKKVYRAIGCKGLARIDFFLSDDGALYFNEINTMPGISEKSIFSKMMEAVGISYKDLITRLILDCFGE